MKIEVLVGMIASGKSTYARRRADEGALVVCHDDLTSMLHASYRYEDGLRQCYRRIEQDIVSRAHHEGRDAVIDRTHLTRESRRRWIDFGRWPHFAEWSRPQVVAIAFPIEAAEVHARRRFDSDPRGRSLDDWIRVAVHHEGQAQLEPLGPDEGFDLVTWSHMVRRGTEVVS